MARMCGDDDPIPRQVRDAVVHEIESSFVESDRLRRTDLICADVDPDEIDALMEWQQVERRARLRECIVESLRESQDMLPVDFFD
jgi:hypothetical protein